MAPPEQNRPPQSSFRQLLAEIQKIALPLLVSGGGLIGFVAFAGGALTWARFSAAELPAEQAVAAMPNSELVAIGAVSLTAFVGFGLLAVLMTYLVYARAVPTLEMFLSLALLWAAEAAVILALAPHRDGAHFWWAVTLVVVGFLATAVVIWRSADQLVKVRERRVKRLEDESGWFTKELIRLAKLTPESIEDDKKTPTNELTLRPWGRGACLALIVGVSVGAGVLTDVTWVGVCLGLGAALAAGCIQIAHRATRFAWFGVAVFFSVALFGVVVQTGRTLDQPQLQPMALIRTGDGQAEGLQGIYVTENDKRVYLASVAVRGCGSDHLIGDSGRLFWVARDQVESYSIGAAQDADGARRAAPEILQDLVATRVPRMTDAKASSAPTATTKAANATAARPISATDARPITVASAVRASPRIAQHWVVRELTPKQVKQLKRKNSQAGAAPDIVSYGSGLNKNEAWFQRTTKPTAAPGDLIAVLGPGFQKSGFAGVGFGPPGSVSIGPVPARIRKWGPAQIVFRVPAGASSNPINVNCPREGGRKAKERSATEVPSALLYVGGSKAATKASKTKKKARK